MTREEILKKAQVKPDTFCPGCWHHVKKILRVFESDSVITADLEELEVRAAAAGLTPKKKRFWLSWVCSEEDHRPVTYPPGIGILGWWCTGSSGEGDTMVAAVQAVDEDDVKVIIKNDWPEFDGSWRFFEELPDEHWRPNSRFPLKDWMKERF